MSDDRTYDALMAHVNDCSKQRLKVEQRLASLESRLRWQQWIMPMLGSLVSSVIVASAILLT